MQSFVTIIVVKAGAVQKRNRSRDDIGNDLIGS